MKKLAVLLLALLFALSLSLAGAEEGEDMYPQVDLDLSQMSGTMVYSQIYQIMFDPDAYLGKIIRLAGWLDVIEYAPTNSIYFSCVVPDATACCASGIEFVWAGEHAYPDDYPEVGAEIVVTGRLESYMEGEYEYLHLVDAQVAVGGEN